MTPSKLPPPMNNFCLYPPPVLSFWKDPLITPHPTSSIFHCYPLPPSQKILIIHKTNLFRLCKSPVAKSLKTNHVQLYKSRVAKTFQTNHVQLYKSRAAKARKQNTFNFRKVMLRKCHFRATVIRYIAVKSRTLYRLVICHKR